MITIIIQRRNKNSTCTAGTFKAISSKKKGKVTGYTLEPPDLGNKPDVSCIPAGEYEAYIRKKKSSKWGYDVIQLKNVPGRSAIQMHAGNYPKNTTGCILVGSLQGRNAVWKSKDKLAELIEFCGDEDVKVVVKD